MFLHLSLSHSVHGWVSATPPRQTPPGQTSPLGRHPPPCPVHARIHTPLPSACWDTHPPCPVHAGIQPTSPPPTQCMLGYSQQAGSTHPTGMHTCLCIALILCQCERNVYPHWAPVSTILKSQTYEFNTFLWRNSPHEARNTKVVHGNRRRSANKALRSIHTCDCVGVVWTGIVKMLPLPRYLCKLEKPIRIASIKRPNKTVKGLANFCVQVCGWKAA